MQAVLIAGCMLMAGVLCAFAGEKIGLATGFVSGRLGVANSLLCDLCGGVFGVLAAWFVVRLTSKRGG
jgi:hypothetical protein